MSIIALVEGTHDDRFSMALKELSSLSEILEVSETGFEDDYERITGERHAAASGGTDDRHAAPALVGRSQRGARWWW